MIIWLAMSSLIEIVLMIFALRSSYLFLRRSGGIRGLTVACRWSQWCHQARISFVASFAGGNSLAFSSSAPVCTISRYTANSKRYTLDRMVRHTRRRCMATLARPMQNCPGFLAVRSCVRDTGVALASPLKQGLAIAKMSSFLGLLGFLPPFKRSNADGSSC